jgi:predicted ester cyclase
VRKFMENFFAKVWGTTDKAAIERAIDDLVSEDCLVHGLPRGENIARAGFKEFRKAFLAAFDKTEVTIEDCIEQGEQLAFRATFQAIHGGRTFTVTGGGMARVRNDKIVEAYNQWDFLGLLHQVEAVPADALMTALAKLTATR